jgi:hypothetical protein
MSTFGSLSLICTPIGEYKSMTKSQSKDMMISVTYSFLRKFCEDSDSLLGTVIAADNAIVPGVPLYLQYVRNAPHYKSTLFEASVPYYPSIKDGVELTTCIADPL